MPNKRREKGATNLTEHAYRSLKAMILAGEIPAAKPLVEREVCLRLGMSRTPVKHAISRLRQEGHNPKLIETLQALYDHLNLIPLRTIFSLPWGR